MAPSLPTAASKGHAELRAGGFRAGFADALPILFGYFAVGFTVAVAAIANGHPVWSPVLLSLTHVSGTSQGAIANGVSFHGGAIPGLGELALLCLALNLRYVLLALAVAQRLGPGVTIRQRLVLAMGITDEIVAMAVLRPPSLTFPYLMGLFASSYLGWNAGTVLGAFGTSLLPAASLKPLGIALYAMFIAIVTPEARKSRATLFCVAVAAATSVALNLLPAGTRPSPAMSTLLAGVAAAALGAFLFPLNGQGEPEESSEKGAP